MTFLISSNFNFLKCWAKFNYLDEHVQFQWLLYNPWEPCVFCILYLTYLPQAIWETVLPISSNTLRGSSSCCVELWPSWPCIPAPNVNTPPDWNKVNTVETLYDTVDFCWSTHKRHSIARPKGRGMGCLLWVQRATYCVDLSKLSSIKYLL